MGRFILGLIGILLGFCFVKYREMIGEMVGDPDWARPIGGIYNLLILLGIFFFFWGLATMTGTSDILFSPLIHLIPGAGSNAAM